MRRKGTDLADGLRRLSSRLNKRSGGGLVQARISNAWDETAGPTVSAHTTEVHLRQGAMMVYVDSHVWAAELSALSESYRTAINTVLGEELVRAMRFNVSKRTSAVRLAAQDAHGKEEGMQTRDQPARLSPEELLIVEASAASIEDSELREAVIRATVADLEWKKGSDKTHRPENAGECR
ncbi:MAG: DUF721 domain-containing protein [Coriobacteriia bacterium]|nr:DUF721 domain-containing protein [Coriobacteriia bacterium]